MRRPGAQAQSADFDATAPSRATWAGDRPTHAAIPAQSAPAGARTQTVLLYLVLAGLALTPGILLKLGVRTGIGQADALLDRLQNLLTDIRFGNGLRFWCGVIGASLMALLLLYPLRKLLAKGRLLGRIGAWFNVHIVFGILGPVLILYHANFGTGSANANVALWSMLAVAASGIVGHFVYASVSAAFYEQQQTARRERDAMAAILNENAVPSRSHDAILHDLEAFDTRLLTPRRGVIASVAARITLERDRARLARAIGAAISEISAARRLDAPAHDRLRETLAAHFGAYVRLARSAASRSIREQLWARWRLFHLPVFLVMVVGGVLHVAAVWNMDGPAEFAADQSMAADVVPSTGTEAAPAAREAPATVTPAPMPAAVMPPPPAAPRTIAKAPGPLPKTAPAFDLNPKLVDAPRPVARPAALARPASPPQPAANTDTDQILAELQRRTSTEAPMSLGGAKPRSLADQITLLKARQQSGGFVHTDAETGFALTGKHKTAECAACHTKPLKEARSADPRTCINCHRQDDVHRGRRPDCASCHTPTRWSDVTRRR